MTAKRFRVFKFYDADKYGVSDDIAEVTVAFCDKEWEADYLCDLLNTLHEENEQLKKQIEDMKIRFKRKYDHEFDEIVDELN